MSGFLSRWLYPPSVIPVAFPIDPLDIPNELWIQIFTFLERTELVSLLQTCRRFNSLALAVLLSNKGKEPAKLLPGSVSISSAVLPLLNMAWDPPPIHRLTCTFDMRTEAGRSRCPHELGALKRLAARHVLADVHLHFGGDLLSSVDFASTQAFNPQRDITAAFCDALSSFGRSPDEPVVFAGFDVFTARAGDIRSWRLDRYAFNSDDAPVANGFGLFSSFSGLLEAMAGLPEKRTTRSKTSIVQHNGRCFSVFPLMTIRSVQITRFSTPLSAQFPEWTLVVVNPDLANWPNVMDLSSPLDGDEWAAILPVLSFATLPIVRMDPECDQPRIHARDLDGFLARHVALRRLYYYPDPLTVPAAPPFPYSTLRHIRNITTTALCASHLFAAPVDVFPELVSVRITGAADGAMMEAFLRLLARHRGSQLLVLQIPSGTWLQDISEDVTRSLTRVNTLVLSGHQDYVDPQSILDWILLFPALRRVGLQACLHPDASQRVQTEFATQARIALPAHIELMGG